jgi:predicted nucleotidyltransferase
MIEAPPNPWQTEDSYRHLCGSFPALRDWNCLEVWRGSIAHGTYVPNDDPLSIDDKDLIGICIPPAEYYVGLREFGSRGTEEIQSDPWDVVVYEHRKALRLLAKGNPNMLCMLWAPPEFTTHYTAAGEALLAERDLFATKAAFPAFRGYAQSQLKKMQKGVYHGYMGEKRRALVDKFGYDTKNASHLIRILRQGITFMQTGELEVYRSDAEELLAIKRGEYSFDDVRRMAAELDHALARIKERSPLPEKPDWDAINKLAVHMYKTQREEQ